MTIRDSGLLFKGHPRKC